ncbi:MAG: alpha/beta fold hydrolase [Kiritimatiellae bacterium]|nr:alpha/beta fold hydrolase [Kiritimatiellia bacterium]
MNPGSETAPAANTLVLIHGMWGGPWLWDEYVRFFEAKGYRCIRPTLRYHDADPKDEPHPQLGTISLLDYAADLEAEIRATAESPVVFGHSMGGLLAQILAARGLARALVLLAPAAPAGILALRLSVVRSFRSILMRPGFWRRPMRLSFEEAVYGMLQLLSPNARKAAYDRLVYESGRAGAEIGFWPFDSRRAARVDPAGVTCPVLVVAGAQDRMTPASVVRKVAAKYQADYREFPRNAHWLLSEPGWEAIAGYVDNWLAQHLTGTQDRQTTNRHE